MKIRGSDAKTVKATTALLALSGILLSLQAVGCDADGPGKVLGRSKMPEMVSLSGGPVASGFVQDVTHETVSVGAFSITKYPVTNGQYAACTRAGACKDASTAAGCTSDAITALRGRNLDSAKSPVTCLAVEDAANYCKWIGGRLPRLAEWLLAARGTAPQRYPWGDSAATCAKNPRAADGPVGTPYQGGDGCETPSESKLVVGAHQEGAAVSGMEDVMTTPGELLASESNAQSSACSDRTAGCFVFGLVPGAMDSVFPIPKKGEPSDDAARAPHVYGFRCLLEES